jgi:WhiB family redox-sensing transcriptional regulator
MAAIELPVDVEALMQPWADVPDARDLLRVLLHRPEWQADAACRGRPPTRWFPGRGGDLEPARAICHACPVRLDCLGYALEHDDVTGVWGGTSRLQRDAARRRGLDAETMTAELDSRGT